MRTLTANTLTKYLFENIKLMLKSVKPMLNFSNLQFDAGKRQSMKDDDIESAWGLFADMTD